MIVLQWLDGSGLREAAFTSVLLAVVAALAISPALPDSGAWRVARSRWIFAFFVVLVAVAARWPSILYHSDLNRDESQMTAQAITLRHDPVPWRSYDGTTSGPLNSAVLVVPAFFGAPIDLATARVVALALILGTLALLFLMTRALYGELAGRIGILLPLSFFCFVRALDFTHYSSELLPVFLLAVAGYGLVRFAVADPEGIALTGLALGCLPFAKLQSLLLGLALFLVALGLIARHDGLTREDRWRCVISLLAGASCVPLFFLIVVILSGSFDDFYVSYVRLAPAYAAAYCCRSVGAGFFVEDPFFRIALAITIVVTAVCAIGVALLGGREARRRRIWLPPVVALALVAVALYSIELPRAPFEHYLILLLWPLAALTAFIMGSLLIEVSRSGKFDKMGVWLAVVLSVCVCAPAIALNLGFRNDYLGRLNENVAHAPDAVTAMLLRHVQPGDRMAIWGWMPRYFVETGALLGTRDSITQFQIDPRVFQSYYRARYLADMRARQPKFFLDAVAPGSFVFKDRSSEGHEAFPALEHLVDADYRLVGEADGVRLYQRVSP